MLDSAKAPNTPASSTEKTKEPGKRSLPKAAHKATSAVQPSSSSDEERRAVEGAAAAASVVGGGGGGGSGGLSKDGAAPLGPGTMAAEGRAEKLALAPPSTALPPIAAARWEGASGGAAAEEGAAAAAAGAVAEGRDRDTGGGASPAPAPRCCCCCTLKGTELIMGGNALAASVFGPPVSALSLSPTLSISLACWATMPAVTQLGMEPLRSLLWR